METKEIICPKCKDEILTLRFEKSKVVTGDLSIDNEGNEEFEEEYFQDQDNYTYKCPSCDEVLFTDDEEAISFLKGEKQDENKINQ
jgi:peptide methionine sulfoxide reductase MsrB